jgi:formylglycine-generating enzyme required for sulfatase activity
MVIVDGPVEFRMGSPLSEPNRRLEERTHLVKIPRRYAIASKEVSIGNYNAFLRERKGLSNEYLTLEPEALADEPQGFLLWYEAIDYCNWLSEKENLEPVYLPNEQRKYAQGVRIRDDAERRNGYRLPTEAEWEYACRAGSITSRYYGNDVAMLPYYAWFIANAPERAGLCGSLLPNELGLFDMLGNMQEWCFERKKEFPADPTVSRVDSLETGPIEHDVKRPLRGGSMNNHPRGVRSASRSEKIPGVRFTVQGFRLARTLP